MSIITASQLRDFLFSSNLQLPEGRLTPETGYLNAITVIVKNLPAFTRRDSVNLNFFEQYGNLSRSISLLKHVTINNLLRNQQTLKETISSKKATFVFSVVYVAIVALAIFGALTLGGTGIVLASMIPLVQLLFRFFEEKNKWKVLPMTLVYTVGLPVIMISKAIQECKEAQTNVEISQKAFTEKRDEFIHDLNQGSLGLADQILAWRDYLNLIKVELIDPDLNDRIVSACKGIGKYFTESEWETYQNDVEGLPINNMTSGYKPYKISQLKKHMKPQNLEAFSKDTGTAQDSKEFDEALYAAFEMQSKIDEFSPTGPYKLENRKLFYGRAMEQLRQLELYYGVK